MKKQTLTLEKDGYKTVWEKGPKGSQELYCDVFLNEVKVLEWSFPWISGNALNGNAAIFLDQAIIYAKNPPGQKTENHETQPTRPTTQSETSGPELLCVAHEDQKPVAIQTLAADCPNPNAVTP